MTPENEKRAHDAQQASYGLQPAEAKWNDLSTIDKLNRLRLEAQNSRHERQWIIRRIQRLEEAAGKMRLHQHALDGEVMVRIADAESRNDTAMTVAESLDPLA